MKTINIQAAKTHLSRLVDQVVAGEEIVLAKAGKPLVRLVPFREPGKARRGGQYAGQIVESLDCWDRDELAESIAAPLYALAPSRAHEAKVAEPRPRE
jgi:prevent-host-death family protein